MGKNLGDQYLLVFSFGPKGMYGRDRFGSVRNDMGVCFPCIVSFLMGRLGKRPADNVKCIGCGKSFRLLQALKRHLGSALYAKYKKGLLTAAACARNSTCHKVLKGRMRSVKPGIPMKRSRGLRVVVLRRPAQNIAVVSGGRGLHRIPPGLEDVPSMETNGVCVNTISDGVGVLRRIPCVVAHVGDETGAEKRVLYRFLLFVMYSLHATQSFAHRNLYFSESSLAIAIGDVGMSMLDDVRCFAVLYVSLIASFDSLTDVVLWVMIAHMLVRPGLIEHLRVEVCSKGTRPTADGIAHVISVLARRHGHVPSRMAAGKRTWRQVDVFSIASTQTLGAHYCGSHKINAQLLQYEKLESIALKIASYRGQTVDFGDIVGAIGGSGLACYAPRGYWTVHLARVFVPRFGGITLLDGVRYSPECARVLYKMGSGASSMILLGITEVNVYDRGLALCKCIVSLGKRLGLHVSMDFAHLACAVCEAHRRNVLGVGMFSRRSGL